MGNALAIAAVTAVLMDRLSEGLINGELDGMGTVKVSSQPPERLATANGADGNQLNLYLYRVTPNTGWANTRLPSRSAKGQRLTNPYLALDLHYLLSAYATDDLIADILLGYGMHILHETPVLPRELIKLALKSGTSLGDDLADDAAMLPPAFRTLVAADLADQVEQIRITLAAADTEEISRIWSALNTGLRPSAMYQATVVLIEAQQGTRAALPVRKPVLHIPPLRRPRIDRLLAERGGSPVPVERTTITHGDRIVVEGSGLLAEDTYLLIGPDEELAPPADSTDRRIVVDVPNELLPGIVGVQVEHRRPKDQPSDEEIPIESSNLRAFVLSPSISSNAGAITWTADVLVDPTDPAGPVRGTIELEFEHEVGLEQRAFVALNELSPPGGRPAREGRFEAAKRTVAGTTLTFPVPSLMPDEYLLRVLVDGAASSLKVDATTGAYSGPTIQVTAP